jgi:hypothetical protein
MLARRGSRLARMGALLLHVLSRPVQVRDDPSQRNYANSSVSPAPMVNRANRTLWCIPYVERPQPEPYQGFVCRSPYRITRGSNASEGDSSRPPAATWREVFAYFLPEIVTGAASLVLALVQLQWLTQSQEVPTVLGLATSWAVISTSVLLGLQLLPADRLHRRASGAVTTLARVRLVVRHAFAGVITNLVGTLWRTRVASTRMRSLTNSWPAPSPLQLARFVAELRAPGSPQRCAEAGAA